MSIMEENFTLILAEIRFRREACEREIEQLDTTESVLRRMFPQKMAIAEQKTTTEP